MVANEDRDSNHIMTIMTLMCPRRDSTEQIFVAFLSNNFPGLYRFEILVALCVLVAIP